ncbi:MAG: triose-phosphate isomerase [Pseudomonadota bacterium]
MRRLLIVGNWKMNGSLSTNLELLQGIEHGVENADIAVCVPAVYLAQVQAVLVNSKIRYGAQDVSLHINGAYTGEISVSMLNEFACTYAIVGHSERRQYHHETNLMVAQKALTAVQGGLNPIICLGETLEQREGDLTLDVIAQQLQAVITVLGSTAMKTTVIAYEPVWAIGTGLTATPEQAQEVHAYIRSLLGKEGDSIAILYGGSVKAGNARELFEQVDIDGALVGGASLNADEFLQIAKA